MRGETVPVPEDDLLERTMDEYCVPAAIARELLSRESDVPTAVGRTTMSGYLDEEEESWCTSEEADFEPEVEVLDLPIDRLSGPERCLAVSRGWIDAMEIPVSGIEGSDDAALAVPGICEHNDEKCNCRTSRY